MMELIIPLIKKNEKTEDCFFKVKNYYLKFLKKEKIYNSSVFDKISNLKNIYIPLSFWIEKEYQKKRGKILFLGFSVKYGFYVFSLISVLKFLVLKSLKKFEKFQVVNSFVVQ